MMSKNSFAHLPVTPAEHFKLFFYAAVLCLLDQVYRALGSRQAAFERFPFLAGYNNELVANGLDGLTSSQAIAKWLDALHIWEQRSQKDHLPLRALRQAANLDDAALTLLISIGLSEEDARFGLIFEALQGIPSQRRPTLSLLNTWGTIENGRTELRTQLRRLQEMSLVRVVNPETPRLEWALQVPGALWDALRGERHDQPTPWARFRPVDELPSLDDLILPDELQQQLAALPALLAGGDVQAVIVRGAQHNGRRTLLSALARALGRGVLEISSSAATVVAPPIHSSQTANEERWHLAGPLATALHALPILLFDLAPEETAQIPHLSAFDGTIGIVLGKQGGVSGDSVERALTLTLEMPDADARQRHWQRACGQHQPDDVETISERFRLTGGNIRRAASLAQSYTTLAGRTTITLSDVQQATRTLNRETLDSLATRVNTFGDWGQVAVSRETQRELENLENRCRHREHLRQVVGTALGAQLNPGVRALFSGPSGTGKTLAARLLAASLEMDLYRLDLSAVVNKYIGETEKNLNQIFSRAEELDVILLLDEGDALFTQRTSVQTSNDRYANLETNFLLQRLESFEGILIVTTNAGERIDGAFQRRMDVVISFRPPDVEERWAIWQLHLPPAHAVQSAFLEQVAQRCILSGGQIRNAVLQASLLALDDGGIVTSLHLEAAIQREYSKAGAVCPLRPQRNSEYISRPMR